MNFEEGCWVTGLIMAMAFLVNNDLIFFGILGCISIFISVIFIYYDN